MGLLCKMRSHLGSVVVCRQMFWHICGIKYIYIISKAYTRPGAPFQLSLDQSSQIQLARIVLIWAARINVNWGCYLCYISFQQQRERKSLELFFWNYIIKSSWKLFNKSIKKDHIVTNKNNVMIKFLNNFIYFFV